MKFKWELCSDMDTNGQQLLIWLDTKNEKTAKKRAKGLIKILQGKPAFLTHKPTEEHEREADVRYRRFRRLSKAGD